MLRQPKRGSNILIIIFSISVFTLENTDKPLARLIKKIKDMIQLNKISNVTIEVPVDTTEVQRIIRDYSQEIYANKITTWKKWTHYKNDETF